MRTEDYDLMRSLEADYWWFAGMRRVTSALLSAHIDTAPRDVLDVGCGTGMNLLWFCQQFRPMRIVGCDYSMEALDRGRDRVRSARSYAQNVVPRLARGDVRRLPFSTGSFDLVTILDVLDVFGPGDDVRGMAELHRVLRPGGIALVREPAYQWLLSSHDELFETVHRYSASELRSKMSSAGFRVLKTTYANTFLFPVAMTQRLLRKATGIAPSKTDAQPWPRSLQWLNGIFRSLLYAEARLMSRGVRLPFGLSVICIGRKL